MTWVTDYVNCAECGGAMPRFMLNRNLVCPHCLPVIETSPRSRFPWGSRSDRLGWWQSP
jgi:hypothetical protein